MLEKDLISIQECLYAISHIEEYVRGIDSIESLITDSKTYDAVLMNFIIIGEASNRISDKTKIQLKDIDWRAIIGFRNFVAHDYFGIDVNIVWAAIQINLPHLKIELTKLIVE